MADTSQNAPSDLPGDLSYASMDTAFAVASIAYGMSASGMLNIDSMASTLYQELIRAGWTEVPT